MEEESMLTTVNLKDREIPTEDNNRVASEEEMAVTDSHFRNSLDQRESHSRERLLIFNNL
jgi:hypothetical protein